jgi:hypothetical protein
MTDIEKEVSTSASFRRSPEFMQIFTDLTDIDASKRATATSSLVDELRQAQTAHGDSGPSPKLQYTLTRLVQGLASNRGGSRQGFAGALTEVGSRATRVRSQIYVGVVCRFSPRR